MDDFWGGVNRPLNRAFLYKSIFDRNEFSEMTESEIRAVLDGAGGVKKQQKMLDYLTGMDFWEKTNPFYDVF